MSDPPLENAHQNIHLHTTTEKNVAETQEMLLGTHLLLEAKNASMRVLLASLLYIAVFQESQVQNSAKALVCNSPKYIILIYA